MSHKTVYVTIPDFVLKGEFSKELIEEKVESLMRHYVEETAEEDDFPTCDWYVIGGRWAGTLAARKGAQNVLPAESNTFGFEFINTYSVVVNGGQPGHFVAGEKEFIPINAALVKNIEWTAPADLQSYMEYRLMQMAAAKEPLVANMLHQFRFEEDGLYPAQGDVPVLKKNETFEQWCDRLNKTGVRGILMPDAYTDRSGMWHDENEIWAQWQEAMMEGGEGFPDNPMEAAPAQFEQSFYRYIDEELQPDDCLVILDCHEAGLFDFEPKPET